MDMGIIRTQVVDAIPLVDVGRMTRGGGVIIPSPDSVTAVYRRGKCMCTREYRGHRTRRDTTGESADLTPCNLDSRTVSLPLPCPGPSEATAVPRQCTDSSREES